MAFRLNGNEKRKIRKTKNPIDKDVVIKRALGVPESCLTKAYEELGIGKS